jgi:surface protein
MQDPSIKEKTHLSKWNVTDMEKMFGATRSFNGDLSKWNVNNVRDMIGMFRDAKSFDRKNAPWYS